MAVKVLKLWSACTSNDDLCFSLGGLDAVPRNKKKHNSVWERSGSILECLTWDQFKRLRVRASPASLYCVLEQDTSIPPRSAVGNVSGYRCVSDCRSRGREFDPGPVPYFRGDWSWNNFYGHSPPFRWSIQEGLLSVTSESMCTNYWLTACSSLPRKKCG